MEWQNIRTLSILACFSTISSAIGPKEIYQLIHIVFHVHYIQRDGDNMHISHSITCLRRELEAVAVPSCSHCLE